MDKKEIRKKMLLGPLDWITLSPFILGCVGGIAAWAMKMDLGLCFSIAIIPSLISVGVYAQRLLVGWDEKVERIVRDWRNSLEKQRDGELDILYNELKKDGDPRTESLLRDLRTLLKVMEKDQQKSKSMGTFDIISDVDKIFQRCVDYLKESLELWKTAESMTKTSIKKQLLDHRKALVDEVEKSLEDLGNVLGKLKRGIINSSDHQHMTELRSELQMRLKVAEEVEEKMASFRTRHQEDTSEERKYLDYNKL